MVFVTLNELGHGGVKAVASMFRSMLEGTVVFLGHRPPFLIHAKQVNKESPCSVDSATYCSTKGFTIQAERHTEGGGGADSVALPTVLLS